MSRASKSTTPTDFPAEFARLAAEADAHLEAVDVIVATAYRLRDELLSMHPEVERWSPEQDRLERLYGLDALFDAINIVEDY